VHSKFSADLDVFPFISKFNYDTGKYKKTYVGLKYCWIRIRIESGSTTLEKTSNFFNSKLTIFCFNQITVNYRNLLTVLVMHRMLILPTIRPAGYSANLNAGYGANRSPVQQDTGYPAGFTS
jgi:hypothetical protein